MIKCIWLLHFWKPQKHIMLVGQLVPQQQSYCNLLIYTMVALASLLPIVKK